MKPEPCHLALKLLDADEPCGACGHAARTHRNHASYVDPDAKPTKPDEFDGWTPPMLRAAIAFERTTIAELRLELHREREQRQALELGIVEIRHAACAALTWATDGTPDVVNTKRAVDELARRLRDELAASKNDTATLIRERDAARGEAKALEELRPALAAARKELAELRAEFDVDGLHELAEGAEHDYDTAVALFRVLTLPEEERARADFPTRVFVSWATANVERARGILVDLQPLFENTAPPLDVYAKRVGNALRFFLDNPDRDPALLVNLLADSNPEPTPKTTRRRKR